MIEAEIHFQALYILSTTLEHKFGEMSNLSTDRISGGVEQRRVFPLKYFHPWTIVELCGFWSGYQTCISLYRFDSTFCSAKRASA